MTEEAIGWSFAVEHMWTRHLVLLSWAQEAVRDTRRLIFDPDPASLSGAAIRIIGYSRRADMVLAVIVVRYGGRYFAASAWKANASQTRRYREWARTDD